MFYVKEFNHYPDKMIKVAVNKLQKGNRNAKSKDQIQMEQRKLGVCKFAWKRDRKI